MRPRSFRGRLLAGAFAWSIGLLVLASAGLAHALDNHPGAPRVVHGILQHPLTSVFTIACLAFGLLQVRTALSGLDRVRAQLGALHDGRERRLDGAFPSEVQPLVTDLNRLLDQRDQTVQRASTAAGNLAHGLKTPLAVLTVEAERTAAAGHGDLAASIQQQVDQMRRQVDYHLARARATSGQASGARSTLRESIDGLVRTLTRLHATRDLAIDVQVDPALSVRVRRADVDEMLGNLLDNACRWARSRVLVAASQEEGRVTVTVDDDGPGIAPEMWSRVLQRGVRADESGPGSGLGLAIVRDLAELYEGAIALGRSPLGGLRVLLELPS